MKKTTEVNVNCSMSNVLLTSPNTTIQMIEKAFVPPSLATLAPHLRKRRANGAMLSAREFT